MGASDEDVALAARLVVRLKDENDYMRRLIEEACDSMECGEYCPFWDGDDVPCRAQAVMRHDV